ncbi:hypothetical protein DFP72DRAFT_898916 [Ephemerocybe angulata]|uniref:F-box domain-containing protein n=1 Tax=Ephemerocybe angulata TaxID=980116 RepID=A0A8H6M3M6_9AGAR|nr:hypothetical protein DFP72DRAFT_898916 [Tulosesus angulatus]
MAQVDAQPALIDDLFNCPPAYNAILACLSPADIIRAGKTCRLLRDAVESFNSLAYNINRHLEHFLADPIAFRRLQAKGDFLISGSNALQFLDRTFYLGSDLDIFAYPDTVKEIGQHLIDKEGYVFEPGEKQAKSFEDVKVKKQDLSSLGRSHSQAEFVYNSGMSDLLRFKHPRRDLEIQLIGCRRTPLDCVLYFHSTCVMNIITHDAAYALYPKATFDKRISLQAFDKYSERGWSFFTDLTAEGVRSIESSIATDITRYLDDKFTWRLPLDTGGLDLDEDSKSKTIAFQCNSWRLNRDFNGFSTQMTLGIAYQVFPSRSLEQTYLVAEKEFGDAIDQMIDYLEVYNPSRRTRKYLDSYLPDLRDAHHKYTKRVYEET